MKTKGFNLEKKLIALLTIALLWCYLTGLWIESTVKIRIKNHGRKEKSTFRKGLDHFTKILNSFENLIYETKACLKFCFVHSFFLSTDFLNCNSLIISLFCLLHFQKI